MRTIANELVAAMTGVPELFYLTNPKPADQIAYPYAVFEYTYEPATAKDGTRELQGIYDVTLELDLFSRAENALAVLDFEETIVDALAHYRAMRPAAWSMARMDLAHGVPTLVDGLFRRHLQFTIRMTLREKG